jgi:glycosyltransferase involved in cell wall biosynthesis
MENNHELRGISVVIPVYNEEDNVQLSYQEITGVLRSLNEPYEIIFIDDGSSDNTLDRLWEVAAHDEAVKIIQFRRNFGQTAAMAAGFAHTTMGIVVSLDGDLQNDAAEIPVMIAKLREGYDLVAGWRKDRKDKFFSRRLPSMIANRLISLMTKVHLHDYGCTLKVMTGEVARGIRLYGEMHRFIPALADEYGARIAEVPVNHRARRFGSSKYGISRVVRVVLDLMTVKFLLGYSNRPIHLFGVIGLTSGLGGFFLLLYLTWQRMVYSVAMGNRPMVILGVMLCLIGLQFLVFGLLAEMLARTYYESQSKATFVIRNVFQGGRSIQTSQSPIEDEESLAWDRRVAN